MVYFNMQVKIMASLDDKNSTKTLGTKPCDHIFIKALINTLMKMTDACVILKVSNFSILIRISNLKFTLKNIINRNLLLT